MHLEINLETIQTDWIAISNMRIENELIEVLFQTKSKETYKNSILIKVMDN